MLDTRTHVTHNTLPQVEHNVWAFIDILLTFKLLISSWMLVITYTCVQNTLSPTFQHTHTHSENSYININIQKHGHKHYRSLSRGPPVCQKYTYLCTVYMIKKRHHLYTMANSKQETFNSSWATSVHSKIHWQSTELTHIHSTLDKTGSTHTTVKEKASKHRHLPHWQ